MPGTHQKEQSAISHQPTGDQDTDAGRDTDQGPKIGTGQDTDLDL